MDELINVLSKFVSPDQNELRAAEIYLQQAAASNLANFLTELSNVIGNKELPIHIRMAAGLQFKNNITAKDSNLRLIYHQKWLNISSEVRNYIKQKILQTLAVENTRPSAAAQCAAYIAVIEIPHNLWQNLIAILVQNITSGESNICAKEGSLETIGYICQEIEPKFLQSKSNEILTAIIHGMRNNESPYVCLAATTALLNSLEFTNANFTHENERNYIMQVVCEATQSPDTQIQVRSLQCLVKIMSLYYHYMEPYMGPALFGITLTAMKSVNEEVALQGIEFWSTVCDEEIDQIAEALECFEEGMGGDMGNQTAQAKDCKYYVKSALPFLVPILTECLTKQDENADEDEWNPCKAAGVCLMLMASCCANEIVQPVLPFIVSSIDNGDWHYRDGAVMAFGCIMEGPSPDILKMLVEQALPRILKMLQDPVPTVRETASWTIGRICMYLPDTALNPSSLGELLNNLVEQLGAEAKIAVNVCWALSSLVEAAYQQVEAQNSNYDSPPETFIMSPQYETIVERLVMTSERTDGHHNNLRGACFQAIGDFLKCCPSDSYSVLLKTTGLTLDRLKQVIVAASQNNQNLGPGPEQAQINEIQTHLCSVLQSALKKLKPDDLSQIADLLMASLLQMLSASGKATGVQEDVLMTISAMIEGYGDKFYKYMDAFLPFLVNSLKCAEDTQVCIAAIMVVVDLYRNLGRHMLHYTDTILGLLLQILANPLPDRSLKPHIFSSVGDIALALGTSFQPYASVVLVTLEQAAGVRLPAASKSAQPGSEDQTSANDRGDVDNIDDDLREFVHGLWDSCIEAYTGIVHGLGGNSLAGGKEEVGEAEKKAALETVEPFLGTLVNFLETVAGETDHNETLLVHAASLIGDLCNVFGAKMKFLIDSQEVSKLFARLKAVKNKKHKTSIAWAMKQVKIVQRS